MDAFVAFIVGTTIVFGSTPKLEDIKVVPIELVVQATVYGYTSLPELTDSTPFITASGERTEKGVVANNCLPFGKMIYMEGKLYQIKDRMHSRYTCDSFDFWFETYTEARNFGKQRKLIFVLNDG